MITSESKIASPEAAAALVVPLRLPPGGSLSGTTSAAAASGLAIFDSLVINQAGSRYMLVASASGMASVTSAPFTVFGATGSAARAP